LISHTKALYRPASGHQFHPHRRLPDALYRHDQCPVLYPAGDVIDPNPLLHHHGADDALDDLQALAAGIQQPARQTTAFSVAISIGVGLLMAFVGTYFPLIYRTTGR